MIKTNPWDKEYKLKGIPSSYKNTPSSSLLWCLDIIFRKYNLSLMPQIIDIGCGTGRNSIYLNSESLDLKENSNKNKKIKNKTIKCFEQSTRTRSNGIYFVTCCCCCISVGF